MAWIALQISRSSHHPERIAHVVAMAESTGSIDISTNDSVPATDNEIIASLIEQGTIYEAHPQPIDRKPVR